MKSSLALMALYSLVLAMPAVEELQTSLATQQADGLTSGICIYFVCKSLSKAGLSCKSYGKCKEGCKTITNSAFNLGCAAICNFAPSIALPAKACTEFCEELKKKDLPKKGPTATEIDKEDAKKPCSSSS